MGAAFLEPSYRVPVERVAWGGRDNADSRVILDHTGSFAYATDGQSARSPARKRECSVLLNPPKNPR